MVEIRLHGRGGQGAVIACHLLANALHREGHFVQSFPFFGFERRGAPVAAFVRFDDKPVRLRCGIYQPDHLIVFDAGLAEVLDLTAGLKPGGRIVVNSARPGLPFPAHFRVATVNANAIAGKYGLGPPTLRAVNTTMLGAFARATGLVSLEALAEAIRAEETIDYERNVQAMREAFASVMGDEL